ncbi:MAG: hypothetical protein HYS80_01395 [Candidatus Aenigmarchaeota archaeon]|nr:hypothetical protein [Candidatus Aenigmarchaeota archaeon]
MPNSEMVADGIILDTVNPSVGAVSPTSAILNLATTFSATVSDATSGININKCDFYAPNAPEGAAVNQGSMTVAENNPAPGGDDDGVCESGETCTASKSHTFTTVGPYSVYASCEDNSGRSTSGSSVTVSVTAPGCKAMDCTSPTYPAVYNQRPSDGWGMTTCFVGDESPWEKTSCSGINFKPFSLGASRSVMDKMCPTDSHPDGTECHIRLPCTDGGVSNVCWSAQSQRDGVWDNSERQCVTCTGPKETTVYGQSGNYAILYSDDNYGGNGEVFVASDNELNDNFVEKDKGFFQSDTVSSLIVSGCSVTLYEDANFGGAWINFGTSQSSLPGWDNRASSVFVSCPSPVGAIYSTCGSSGLSVNKCEKACGAPTVCDDLASGDCTANPKKKCDSSCNEVTSCGDGQTSCGEACDYSNPSDPFKDVCAADCTRISGRGTCTTPADSGSLALGASVSPSTVELTAKPTPTSTVDEDVINVSASASGYLYVDLNGPGASCDWDFWVGQSACASPGTNLFRSNTTVECDSSARSSARVDASQNYYTTVHRNAVDGSGTLTVRLEDCYSNDIDVPPVGPGTEDRSNQCNNPPVGQEGRIGRCTAFLCSYPTCQIRDQCATNYCCGTELPNAAIDYPTLVGQCASKTPEPRTPDKKFICSS